MAIGEDRNRRGTASLILARHRRWIEVRQDIALARGGALDLGYDCRAPGAHGRNEIARRRRVFGAGDNRDIANGGALLLKLFAFGGEYLVQYRAHLVFDFFPILSHYW